MPKTTLYRHVGMLANAGLLEVAGEQRVRGMIERHYRLRHDALHVDLDTAQAMSNEDHRHGFAVAMAALLAEFNAYLDRPGADPAADRLGYRQGTLWLSPEEMEEVAGELLEVLTARAGNGPAPRRRPHVISAIFFSDGTAEQGRRGLVTADDPASPADSPLEANPR
ncbi:hypothetical protein GCM10022419_119640 [Nonomuraea rosea]|uniref:ArsR family transcriptional regulator n=1 Tax=Nonomuraea rosea TaxID=638574 RepID=A0ABP6ZPS3_9ACTN